MQDFSLRDTAFEEASSRFRRGHRHVADVYLLAIKSDANEDAKYYLADQILQDCSEEFSIHSEAFPKDIRGVASEVLAFVLCKAGGDDSEGLFTMLEDRDAVDGRYGTARKQLVAILRGEEREEGDEREDDEYRLEVLQLFFARLPPSGPLLVAPPGADTQRLERYASQLQGALKNIFSMTKTFARDLDGPTKRVNSTVQFLLAAKQSRCHRD